jgi:hypothetical protein
LPDGGIDLLLRIRSIVQLELGWGDAHWKKETHAKKKERHSFSKVHETKIPSLGRWGSISEISYR